MSGSINDRPEDIGQKASTGTEFGCLFGNFHDFETG
jgi:hypothetical protein